MKMIHTKTTLMGYSKKQLVEMIEALEHNNLALHESIEVQYRNAVKIYDELLIFKTNYKNAKALKLGKPKESNLVDLAKVEVKKYA